MTNEKKKQTFLHIDRYICSWFLFSYHIEYSFIKLMEAKNALQMWIARLVRNLYFAKCFRNQILAYFHTLQIQYNINMHRQKQLFLYINKNGIDCHYCCCDVRIINWRTMTTFIMRHESIGIFYLIVNFEWKVFFWGRCNNRHGKCNFHALNTQLLYSMRFQKMKKTNKNWKTNEYGKNWFSLLLLLFRHVELIWAMHWKCPIAMFRFHWNSCRQRACSCEFGCTEVSVIKLCWWITNAI